MQKRDFKKLVIWQEAMDLCDLIYGYAATLPIQEKYNVISQLEKCSVTVASGIAEGSAKASKRLFAESLSCSLSATQEAEAQLLICKKRKYGHEDDLEQLLSLVCSLQSKIFNFREKIINNN